MTRFGGGGCLWLVICLAVIAVVSCGLGAPPAGGTARLFGGGGLVLVGEPLRARPVKVWGFPDALELQAADPGRSAAPSLSSFLVRRVLRVPGDVCVEISVAHQNPQDGSVACGARGFGPRVSREGEMAISGERGPAELSRHPGEISNGQVGEKILELSYPQLVSRFGPPLKMFTRRAGERCVYYAVVGSARGWVFCFRAGTMVSAAGNQTPPAEVHSRCASVHQAAHATSVFRDWFQNLGAAAGHVGRNGVAVAVGGIAGSGVEIEVVAV